MRRFLCEYDSVWTEEQLRDFFANESDDREYMTFEQWLAECMGKNGALVEILTDDTPNGERHHAVCCYAVQNNEGDVWEEWLTEGGVNDRKSDGFAIVPTCREDYV
jgi:hypothetical protein